MKDSPIKIALFEPYVFDRIYGNLKYILGIYKYIDQRECKPILISQTPSRFLDQVEKAGGQTMVLAAPKRLQRFGGGALKGGVLGLFMTCLSILRYTLPLYRCLRKERIDIVHCNSIRALLVIGIAAKCAGKPLLWYVKGHLDNSRLDRVGFRWADRILFQAESNRDRKYPELVERYWDKIEILPNGIDLEEIEALGAYDGESIRAELKIDAAKVNIAYLGQLSPLKGVHVLIDAMQQVVEADTDTVLYLIGDHCNIEYEPYVKKIRDMIEKTDLSDNVRFTGFRSDALKIIKQMDMLVLPSFSEGFPRSLMEAMALGKPTVATPVGGVRELVDHGETGTIVPVEDAEALAAAMVDLIKNKDKRELWGTKGREKVYCKHSLKENVSRLKSIYDTML